MEKNDQMYSGVPATAVVPGATPYTSTAPTAIVAQPAAGMEAGYPSFVDFGKYKPIPDSFTRLGCMACGCSNCEAKDCCGGKTLAKCCCLEYESNCCRVVENDEKVCCLWSLLSFECVDFENTFKFYTQAMCFECVCGSNVDESYVDVPPVILTNYGRIDERDLYPWSTACCFCCGSIDSLYLKFPQCVGIYTNSENCCSYTSNACLKPMCGDETNPKKNLQFLCVRNRFLCVRPRVCCKDQSQVFCIDHRCACPYDDDVPCAYMFPLTFYTLCIDYHCVGKCFMSYGDYLQFQAESRGKANQAR